MDVRCEMLERDVWKCREDYRMEIDVNERADEQATRGARVARRLATSGRMGRRARRRPARGPGRARVAGTGAERRRARRRLARGRARAAALLDVVRVGTEGGNVMGVWECGWIGDGGGRGIARWLAMVVDGLDAGQRSW